MAAPRGKSSSKKPIWILVLISIVCISLMIVYLHPPQKYSSCYLLWNVCDHLDHWLPPAPSRVLTDEELISRVVSRDILSMPITHKRSSKIAFMFLTSGSLPFEKLWEKFFQGHEGQFSIYLHSSREKPVHVSPLFIGRDIRSEKVYWGQISMVDAEKRLLANALQDSDNHHFVLLSDSCIPLQSFVYVYNFLMETDISYVDCFDDPGPLGMGRYSEDMLPEIENKDWRKGSQWFALKRQHALLLLSDKLYYTKLKLFCRPAMEGNRNCYPDEHYVPTFLNMADPTGIANWSVTNVDWSEGKWHPRSYRAEDVTLELIEKIKSIDESVHVTSEVEKVVMPKPCLWNGTKRPCYLFARKFYPEALEKLMHIFANYTSVVVYDARAVGQSHAKKGKSAESSAS